MPAGRQVLHLLLGDVELKAVLVDSGHGTERDRYDLAAQHVSLFDEDVGDLVAAGVWVAADGGAGERAKRPALDLAHRGRSPLPYSYYLDWKT